uniref:Uncharacterized protein n=1 Tax=Avena sativa TaxID=4498 RepID=A0ACD5WU14_AVESA
MGLDIMARDRPPRRQYQRLRGELYDVDGEEAAAAASAACKWTRARRPLRLRKRVGMAPLRAGKRGARLLMRLLLVLVPARRAAALLAELVRRIASAGAAAAECPAIVFSSQWGLPALSHSASGGASRTARLRAFYLERSLSAGPSSGAGSPC